MMVADEDRNGILDRFEVKDLCRRLTKVIEIINPIEDQIYGPLTAAAKQPSTIYVG